MSMTLIDPTALGESLCMYMKNKDKWTKEVFGSSHQTSQKSSWCILTKILSQDSTGFTTHNHAMSLICLKTHVVISKVSTTEIYAVIGSNYELVIDSFRE